MPHERLNALLASFIPLIPLLYQRRAQDTDWGNIVTNSEPFAPKYLPPIPELPKDQGLAKLYNHACEINFMLGPRWLRDAISQPLDTSLPVVDALGAIRSHFQVNVATSSLFLWVVGLLLLVLLLFLDLANSPTSSPGKIIVACETSTDVTSATTCPTSASVPAESIKPERVLSRQGASNETLALPPFGYTLSTSFPLTPIEEEDDAIDHDAASKSSPHAAEASDAELVLQCSPSNRALSSLSSQSSHTVIPNPLSPALFLSSTSSPSVQSTPFLPDHASQCAEEAVSEHFFSPLVNDVDTSSISSDFVFTIVPPSASDLDSVTDLGSPSSSQDGVAETFLSPTISDVPSTVGSTQTSPSSPLLSTSLIHQLGGIVPTEKRVWPGEAQGSETSLKTADEAEVTGVLETTALLALDEDPRPTVQELDQPSSPHRSRALSNITEITEPSESSASVACTPRVEWLSGIHGQPASLDHNGVTLQMTQGPVDGTSTASTPEVDVGFDWSLVDVPSRMEDFLPLSTSTPNLYSTAGWQLVSIGDSLSGAAGASQVQTPPSLGLPGDLHWSSDAVTDAGILELPTTLLVDPTSPSNAGFPSSPSSGAHTDLEDEGDEDGGSSGDTTALPPAASVADVSSEVQRLPAQAPARNVDEAVSKTSGSTVESSTVAQTSVVASSPVNVCPLLASPEVPIAPTLPTMSPTVMDFDGHFQTASDQPTPITTHARRASRVLVARTGIANQQVALTDTGLAQLVARPDEPLPPEDDVRGERRRMERVTNTAMAKHPADRGKPRGMSQVIHERRYSNEPISARVERDIIDAAHHPPLKNDPHIRIPVCELGRSRSSGDARSTTNVALVRRPSISASSRDVSAMVASPLVLPRNWGHRRSQSEVVNSSAALIAGDQHPRLSYAAIAASGFSSQQLRPPVVSDELSEPSAEQPSAKEATREPVETKSRTMSAPGLSMSPMFRTGILDDQASWRNGNRWSALAVPAPPSSVEVPKSIDKGKARLQELPSLTRMAPRLVSSDGSPVLEKKWPQSRLLKAPTQNPSTIATKAPEATHWSLSSSGKDDLGASGSGPSKVRGSMLSATCRVKLRDLALSAQQSMAVSPPVVAPSSCIASGSDAASGSACGSDVASGSGVTSSASGSSSDSVVIVCSGGKCVPVSFAQPGLIVMDKIPPAEQFKADFEASDDLLAKARVTLTCPEDTSQLEPVLLLPSRSAVDMHSSPLDDSIDLVIASQECRPPSPTRECPAVVRLSSRSSPFALSSSSRFRRSTAPAHVSSPSTSAADVHLRESPSGASAPPPSPLRHDLATPDVPQSIAVRNARRSDQTPGTTGLARMSPRRRDWLHSRAFPGHRRAITSALLGREQQSVQVARFTRRDGQQN
ncbi:hypothetical protein LXA43DRAFT_1034311 [Ganoderma leucocontextum]|nr:hypothetical protein LXA43DRAFT_1034311 [Ganoderma leucocontextum]